MAIWFTSDHHFGHLNIIRLTDRPFNDLNDMHRTIKAKWNEKITNNDLVYIVGDLSFMQESSTRKLCKKLNGRKILIQGNHDKEKKIPKDCFEEICYKKEIKIGNHDVLLCHYPYKNTQEELKRAENHGYKIKHIENRPENKGQWLIHGHVHNHWKIKRNMINVSVEVWDYYPVSEQEIELIINRDELDQIVSESQKMGLYDENL